MALLRRSPEEIGRLIGPTLGPLRHNSLDAFVPLNPHERQGLGMQPNVPETYREAMATLSLKGRRQVGQAIALLRRGGVSSVIEMLQLTEKQLDTLKVGGWKRRFVLQVQKSYNYRRSQELRKS